MSILQEYQQHEKMIGENKMMALFDYLKKYDYCYSDIIYDKKKWKEFDKWYKEVYNSGHGRGSESNKKI